MILRINNLSKSFPHEEGSSPLEVLVDINLELPTGEFACLVGPSGCGKTTLLQIIAGLEPAGSGKVILGEEEIVRPSNRIGMVFQEYALFPWLNVMDNIGFGLRMAGVPRSERLEQVKDYIQEFELEGFENDYPKALSGGMKQRVAIARTMINNPQVLLMDEPFSSVDSQTRNSLQEFLLRIWTTTKNTVIFVTHNIDEAVFLGQRIIGMSARPGRIIREFPIELPYPRIRTDPHFVSYRAEILDYIKQERQQNGMESQI